MKGYTENGSVETVLLKTVQIGYSEIVLQVMWTQKEGQNDIL